jgi:S-DNA-T family DNA segregation ATPase FtsK/SpoIIIE
MDVKNLPPEQQQVIGRLVLKFQGLKINALFSHLEAGPVITTYYFYIPFDVPLSKVLNKAEDLAISAGVDSVLLSRSGDKIAIEVPNKNRQVVSFHNCLYQMMTSHDGRQLTIPVLLGVDTYGTNKYVELVEQPHILIAGSTGGGKSVLLASIIGALAVAKSEQEIRLTLVDTKRLDLPLFAGLPHLQRICETSKAFHEEFDKLFIEVRRRVALMQGKARNAREWNQLAYGEYLPHHVVVIDELADLMAQDEGTRSTDPNYIWDSVSKRLQAMTQICRAAGVHIIAATQRSSVKVINGDIKANFPTRIALRLPSAVDSRTILSQKGAELLLGKGDMLVESLESDSPRRYHGAFVSNQDISNILASASQIREQLLSLPEATG